jgi:hypothetical protein
MNNKKLLFSSLLSGLFLLLITEPSFSFLHQGYFNRFESGFLEPLFFTLGSYLLSSIILLFFSNKIFKLWLRKIVSWFLPLSIFLIWAGGGGNSYTTPDKTTYAIVLGIILSVVTLIFALVQRFYYKR